MNEIKMAIDEHRVLVAKLEAELLRANCKSDSGLKNRLKVRCEVAKLKLESYKKQLKEIDNV